MPADIQSLADQAYARLKEDPRHPSLHCTIGRSHSLAAAAHRARWERQMAKKQPTTPFKNIDFLVRGNGDVTIGRIGPVRCAAVAADGDQQLAALVRRPRESLEELLARLDAAIEKAWEEQEFVDEING